MAQNNIIKTIAVQALSGSSAWVYVGDGDIDNASLFITTGGTASGSYELQGSIDQVNSKPFWGISGSTGTGAAVAINTVLPPPLYTAPSASFSYIRLSNARFAQNAMTGAVTASLVYPPNVAND